METLKSADFLTELGNRYLKDDLLIEAVAILELTISRHPKHAPAYSSLGYVLMETNKDLKLAEQHLNKAIELDPNYHFSYTYLSKLLGLQQRFPELKKLLKNMKTVPRSYQIPLILELGFQEELNGNFDKAIEVYKSALNLAKEIDEMDNVTNAMDRCLNKIDLNGI
ncbi:lipopolysaccharide assembly protein LapB [Zobellia sp. 1_MG-2023]|uniref:tetratricopeptide repeat protein n=1 Tax=Zobellia sp. 1_MG-2023 TaxID=3062626 RepID=UPI0026E4714C|nr:hypothetical protein [Zobellia sp. 1_MG-2023]MDO6818880.1 hypothetical protein [Zobellia sp. 1_MG-2023]